MPYPKFVIAMIYRLLTRLTAIIMPRITAIIAVTITAMIRTVLQAHSPTPEADNA